MAHEPAAPEAFLYVEQPTGIARFPLETHRRTLVGTAPENDVRILDPRAHKRHATIRWDGAAFEVRPARRTLQLNRGMIAGPHPLRHGDTIQMGGTRVHYVDLAAPATTTLQLVLTDHDGDTWVALFDRRLTMVGKTGGELLLHDAFLADSHCLIENLTPKLLLIQPLSNDVPLYLNDRVVHGRTPVHDGDRLLLGRTKVTVWVHPAPLVGAEAPLALPGAPPRAASAGAPAPPAPAPPAGAISPQATARLSPQVATSDAEPSTTAETETQFLPKDVLEERARARRVLAQGGGPRGDRARAVPRDDRGAGERASQNASAEAGAPAGRRPGGQRAPGQRAGGNRAPAREVTPRASAGPSHAGSGTDPVIPRVRRNRRVRHEQEVKTVLVIPTSPATGAAGLAKRSAQADAPSGPDAGANHQRRRKPGGGHTLALPEHEIAQARAAREASAEEPAGRRSASQDTRARAAKSAREVKPAREVRPARAGRGASLPPAYGDDGRLGGRGGRVEGLPPAYRGDSAGPGSGGAVPLPPAYRDGGPARGGVPAVGAERRGGGTLPPAYGEAPDGGSAGKRRGNLPPAYGDDD